MSRMTLLAALVAVPLIAVPAMAQPAPPPPPPPGMGMGAGMGMGPGMAGDRGAMMGARMFPSMSEAGRAIVSEAMMSGGNRGETRDKVEAARERMLTALAADRFDAAAVKRAMDEERTIADGSRQQRQAAMLAAFQKLSPEDRKAFVADSRAMKTRMQTRMAEWRDRMRARMQMRRGGGQMPPPPPPQQDE